MKVFLTALMIVTSAASFAQSLKQELVTKDCSLVFKEEVLWPRHVSRIRLGSITFTAKSYSEFNRRIPKGTTIRIKDATSYAVGILDHAEIQQYEIYYYNMIGPSRLSAKEYLQYSEDVVTFTCELAPVTDMGSSQRSCAE